jgi:N-acetyl-anhydromuramyl-L-alanine amidase AmpD
MANIIRVQFPESQFIKEETAKTQIVLHHTASGPGVDGDLAWWRKTPERVATHFIIDREGQIYQLFDLKYWGWHLGLSNNDFASMGCTYRNLDRSSVGIELDCWGHLKKSADGRYYPTGMEGKARPVTEVHEYCKDNKWRGHTLYEKYSSAQISALKDLLHELCRQLNIPKKYNLDMWGASVNALKGTPGIWTHASYRKDKSDCHPQPELCEMLKLL